MSAQRALRRRLARQDGDRLAGGCPWCEAEVEVIAADPGYRVHHGAGCPVLAGDPVLRHASNVAAVELLHPDVRVMVATVAPDGRVMVTATGGGSTVVIGGRR
ncbi:MAG: hypothetical protein ACOYML_11495 [Microthrixaceae bacterium]